MRDEKKKFEVRGSNQEVRSDEAEFSPLNSNLEPRTSIPRPRPSSLSLWSGILAGPIAFAINLELRYALVHWACEHGSAAVLLWIAVPLVLVCVAGAFLARTGLAGSQRMRFMAYGGLMLSAISAMSILASMIPDLFLSPCD